MKILEQKMRLTYAHDVGEIARVWNRYLEILELDLPGFDRAFARLRWWKVGAQLLREVLIHADVVFA